MNKLDNKYEFVNKKFNKLLVIKRCENAFGGIAWLCKCDCGNTTIATSHQLLHNSKKSCGCLRKEKMWQNSQINKYDNLTGKKFGKPLKFDFAIFDKEKLKCLI